MANYARIISNVAVDVSTDPATQFHPTIAAQFTAVPAQVQRGWVLNNGEWAPPETAPQPAPAYPKVSPIEFKLLFTQAERLAINAARETDQKIADFFDLVDDPRLTYVDMGLQSTQDALTYLVHKGLITASRRLEILSGQLK